MVECIEVIHEECPNEKHCNKDEERCMYLVRKKCLLKQIKNGDGEFEFLGFY